MDLVATPRADDVIADIGSIVGPRSPTASANSSDAVGEAGRAVKDDMVIRAT
jgi:hypothetical protein